MYGSTFFASMGVQKPILSAHKLSLNGKSIASSMHYLIRATDLLPTERPLRSKAVCFSLSMEKGSDTYEHSPHITQLGSYSYQCQKHFQYWVHQPLGIFVIPLLEVTMNSNLINGTET